MKSEVIKYWYEKYIFYLNDDIFVKMVVLSKTEYGADQNNEMMQTYKTISSFSEELPVEQMSKQLKDRLDTEGNIEEQFELSKELFETCASLSGKELLELNKKLIK